MTGRQEHQCESCGCVTTNYYPQQQRGRDVRYYCEDCHQREVQRSVRESGTRHDYFTGVEYEKF